MKYRTMDAWPESTGPSATILIVDDEPSVRALAGLILRRRGYTVREAAHGKEALEIIQLGGCVDLVVSDIRMPVMGGIELAKELDALCPDTKVLFVSGYAGDSLTTEKTANFATERYSFLSKPFTALELEVRIRQMLT
jgi:two-component system, cell cycle sensor histidine kinase and response regulator CckA